MPRLCVRIFRGLHAWNRNNCARVRVLDAVISKMKSLGSPVVRKTGASVPAMPKLRVAVMPDPNSLYLTLIEPCDECAPRVPPREVPSRSVVTRTDAVESAEGV